MTLFSQKITLFLVLGLAVVSFGIPLAIYYSRRDVTGIGMGLVLQLVLLALVLVGLDRLALRVMPPGWLSMAELVITVVGTIWYGYANRSLTLDLSANPSAYFVVIWTKNTPPVLAVQTRFLFGQVVAVPTGAVVELDGQLFGLTDVKTPANWPGQVSTGIDVTHPRYVSAYFYGPADVWQDRTAQIDSILQTTVARQSGH